MPCPLGLTADATGAGGVAERLGGCGRQPARVTRAMCLALNAIVAEICADSACAAGERET